ncbi:hypothetical protein NESM_000114400 [Novymonas esmeraldas]|uniref:Uncharacterized protein n=1 Tax=Novymonas esmeraldas TaxID=1808958 RepID=A0AAW0F5L0_9TRYP
MSLVQAAVSVNRTLVTVVLLLSLPLLLDVTRLPDSSAAQEYVFSLLSPCDGLGLCNLCGEVLEMVDLVQRALVNPFRDELTLSPSDWDPHGLRSYQRCLREPALRGCDTLVHKVKTQRVEFAKLILEQVIEDPLFRQKWGILGEDYVIGNAVHLTTYIFAAQERLLGGPRDPRKEDGAVRNLVYQSSTLSLGGDPGIESLVTRVWFLRRDVLPLHRDFCRPLCEGKLTLLGRLRLALARFYVRYAIKSRLVLLRQQYRGTLVVAELMMIGFAFCVERIMRPGLAWNGGVVRRITRVRSSSGSGATATATATTAASTSATSGGHGGGGGKGHTRPGRRR